MGKNSKLFLITVSFSILLNCRITKSNTSSIEKNTYEDPIFMKFDNLSKDTLIYCHNLEVPAEFNIKTKEFTQFVLFSNWIDCIVNEAFNGNKNAEDILAIYIRNKEIRKDTDITLFRGERMFRLIMDRSKDFTTKNEYGYIAEEVKRMVIYPMIRSINGKTPQDYLSIYLLKVLKIEKDYYEKIMHDFSTDYHRYELDALMYAYKNNLIIFKQFGEL